MTAPGFPIVRWGPFVRGVVDGANPLLDLTGSARYIRNGVLSGAGRLLVRPGTQVAMTLMDDQGSPAECTSVCAIVAFGDAALAIAHSTITSKFYLYWLNDSLTGWYNASKVLTSTLVALPVGVLWTGAASPETIHVAEGLGVAYLAHANAGATFKTRKLDTTVSPATLTDFQADLRGLGLEDTYFRGVTSFQQHLWGWGYGSQAAGENDRPELLRFGQPFFGTMKAGDSFAVGHRVRSQRERIVAAQVAGQVLYVGTNYSLWPVVGFGRNSWDKSRPLDDSYGFAGPRAFCAARNGWLYYWSHRGPLRVFGFNAPEPLFEALPLASAAVVADTAIVATFDPDRNQVLFLYQNGVSGRVSVLAAFDVLKDVWLGPDADLGLGIRCAGLVQPTLAPGPAGPPTGASTTGVGSTVATANLASPGDASPGATLVWEYKAQAASVWIVANELPVSQLSYQFTGLTPLTAYEWRVKVKRNGQSSAYLGPSAATQFTTVGGLQPPSLVNIHFYFDSLKNVWYARVTWRNSGEADVSTAVYFNGPLATPPASGSLPLKGTQYPGYASLDIGIGAGANGTYYAEVRHTKPGFTDSDLAPIPPVGVFGPFA